jgi:ribose 5-phosphate isomerase B
MKIFFASDHAGFALKEVLKSFVTELDHEAVDCGAHTLDEGDDYPDFVSLAAQKLSQDETARAIILGASGEGEAIVANRFNGIRAIVYYGGNRDIITLSRQDNDANTLSLGARFISEVEAKEAVRLWLSTAFSGDERHVRRIKKIDSND